MSGICTLTASRHTEECPFSSCPCAWLQGVIAAGATGLFLGDIALIIFTPLLQNFPLTFNLIQGFVLCLAGDTYFQVRPPSFPSS